MYVYARSGQTYQPGMDTTCAAGPLPVINLSNNDDGDNDDGDDSSSKDGDDDFSLDRHGDDDDDSDDFRMLQNICTY